MKIFLGADHGGFEIKEQIKEYLTNRGRDEVTDLGSTQLDEGDDYVDYAVMVARELEGDSQARGLLFCRNGMGMVITANRFSGVRCGFGFDSEAVKRGRTDDDINCLAIPADYLDVSAVRDIVDAFLSNDFSDEERYTRRISKLSEI